MSAFSQSLTSRRTVTACAALLMGVLAAPALRADDDTPPPQKDDGPPGLSEVTTDGLGKLKPLLDAKNWDGAIEVLNPLVAKAAPDSYDMALLLDTKAKLYLQKGDYKTAIPDMEGALRLGTLHKNYFEPHALNDERFLLAEIYGQEGSSAKDKRVQHELYDHSIKAFDSWAANGGKMTPDSSRFYAGLLYAQATSDPDHPDQAGIAKAQKIAQQGLLTTLHPKDDLYLLILASYQQQSRLKDEAALLEYLVTQFPHSKQYWTQLLGAYLGLAANADTEKNERDTHKYYVRAINTIERAQSLGIMTSPKDNYNLVTIYYNAGEFGKATDLLQAGLKNRTIDGDIKNWQLLSYSYQQINRDFQAIDALKEASELYPKSGQLDFSIGQIYSSMENTQEAYNWYKSALEKGGVDKPHGAYMFLAYTAFELGKYDEALAAVKRAADFPEAARDTQMRALRGGIEDAIKERDMAKQDAAKNKSN